MTSYEGALAVTETVVGVGWGYGRNVPAGRYLVSILQGAEVALYSGRRKILEDQTAQYSAMRFLLFIVQVITILPCAAWASTSITVNIDHPHNEV